MRGLYPRWYLQDLLQSGDLWPIEGFRRYTIMPDGTVVNIRTGRSTQASAPTGRQVRVSLVDDSGRLRHCPLARLIAEHLIPKPDNTHQYEVAFKDGNFWNVDPDNLMWVRSDV